MDAWGYLLPPALEPHTLYVSMEYGTVVHLCACDCGRKVVTPLSPKDWKLIFDGSSLSLSPSIGNWQYPCRSHYWIRNSQVEWAYDSGIAADAYTRSSGDPRIAPEHRGAGITNNRDGRFGLWQRLRGRLRW